MSIASEISRISQNVSDSLSAVATKGVTVPSGSTSDDLPSLILQIQSGSGSAITITDETDSHGGTIRHINAVSLAGDTVTAAHLESGYTAHDSLGNSITGTLVPGGTPSLQAKTNIAPTESSQTIQPDSGYDGLSSVQINAISSSYVGSGITRRSSTDLTASGDTVTVPAGYYSAQATKAVSSMTLPTSASASATSGYSSKATISRSTSDQYINIPPGYNSAGGYYKVSAVANMTLPTSASASATSGYTSKATIGRSTSDQYINIPTGYNTAGAYYKISAVANGSVTAPSTISGSSATVSTGTNTLTLTKTISVTPNVTTAGYISSGTAGNASVSLTASVTTQAAQTIHPSTTDQSIAASRYLTGAQTIKAVIHNLDATKILSGTTFKIGDSTDDDCVTSVAGSLAFQTIYSGSSAPSSSTGVNGDIYIQTA